MYIYVVIDLFFSPVPGDIHFLTLWCRTVIAKLSTLRIGLRDYPLNILDVEQAHIFGRLIGAESQGSARGKRVLLININLCPYYFQSFKSVSCN